MELSGLQKYYQAVKIVLEKSNRAMSIGEIWEEIEKNNFFGFGENFGLLGKTPKDTLRGELYKSLNSDRNVFFEIFEKKPRMMIRLKKQKSTKIIENIKNINQIKNNNFNDLKTIRQKIENFAKDKLQLKDKAKDEANTKKFFIEPFFEKIFNYDFSNPSCVCLEFDADARKKGDKVDYAILKNDEPFILIEAKHHKENLDNHHAQLDDYFRSVDIDDKFAILTNGIEYRLYADFEKTNKMDKKPFLVINFENLDNLTSSDFTLLEKFIYEKLDYQNIRKSAKKSYMLKELKNICLDEFKNLSDELVEFFTKKLNVKEISHDEIKEHLKNVFDEILIKA